MNPNRRQLLASAIAVLSAAHGEDTFRSPGKRDLLLHNDRPEDLETPNKYLETWLTPTDAFFVRQHLPRPVVNPDGWRLAVNGLVSKKLELSAAELRKLPQYKVIAALECTGNGRDFYRPRVPGIQWKRGAIGNAEWSGPRVSEILKLAGADLDAPFIETDGADVGIAKTPDFVRSMPMRKVLHPATILAFDMNGEPLPPIHGAPARLIVPGWDGTSWVKWVVRITVISQENKGFFMNPAYRYPKYALPPGSPPIPAELEIIEGMRVKSAITNPSDESQVHLGPLTIRGYAWAGEERISQVEVSTDGGSRWVRAQLSPQDLPFAWRLWKHNWTPPEPGYYSILSRATDSGNRVQPIIAPWNPSGYLWNAIDRVNVTVERTA